MKRTTIFFLIGLLSVQSLSCGQTQAVSEDTKVPSVTEAATEAETRQEPNLPEKSFEGQNFTFLGVSGYTGNYYSTEDIYAAGETGEPLNDAVYRRNRIIEEKYNVHIQAEFYKNPGDVIGRAVQSNDCTFDAAFSMGKHTYSHVFEGWFVDFHDLPHVDLTRDWWDQNIQRDMNFSGSNYLMAGDISTVDDSCSILVYFNKDMIEEYNMESPYDLVADNRWTFDIFTKLVKTVSKDVNGDSVIDYRDTFGLLSESGLPNRLYTGIGGSYIRTEDDNTITYSIYDEKNIDRMNAVLSLLNDKTCVSDMEKWGAAAGNNPYGFGRKMFTENHVLFHISLPMVITEFRNMEQEFGIVPIPKYDAFQEQYHAPIDAMCPLLCVPINVPDLEKTGFLLEALAAESMDTVTPVYQETLLERKYTRDNESLAMLQIIKDSYFFDRSECANYGGMIQVIVQAYQSGNPVAVSQFEKRRKSADRQINKELEKLEELHTR